MFIKYYILKWISIVLSIIFIISGILKSFNIKSFSTEISLFTEAYSFPSWFILLRYELAITICIAEIILGTITLTTNNNKILYSLAYVIFMTFFLLLTGLNYYAPSAYGSIESCGCFGDFIHISPMWSFIKCCILWVAALYVFFLHHKIQEKNKQKRIPSNKKTTLFFSTFFTASLIPIYSYLFFNELGHLLYTIIYFILVSIHIALTIRTLLYFNYHVPNPDS